MCKRNLRIVDLEEVTTTQQVRDLLAHNNRIEQPAIQYLNKKGVATPPDILARRS